MLGKIERRENDWINSVINLLLNLQKTVEEESMDAQPESLLEAIDAFPGAVVIVTHSEMILHAIATRLIVFDNGKATLFEGTYTEQRKRFYQYKFPSLCQREGNKCVLYKIKKLFDNAGSL
ncbi:MAG: hypothetical protein HY752_05465 [Nitrospirae bacterium]|nr:hypothetical protein [Nitrospirota bacterium]